MPDELAQGFNRQITLEIESSLAYLQMAAYFESRSFTGFASWMRVQSDEERDHALKLFDYLLDRGNPVKLGEIAAPVSDFDGPTSVFEAALEQERRVSEAIQSLYMLATSNGDAASFAILQWFLEEQVEEESMVEEILDQLKLVGSDGGALLLLDRELGARKPDTGGTGQA